MLLLQRGQDFGHLSICAKKLRTDWGDGWVFLQFPQPFLAIFYSPLPFLFNCNANPRRSVFSFFFSFSKNKLDSLSVKMSDLERKSEFAKEKKTLMRSKKY